MQLEELFHLLYMNLIIKEEYGRKNLHFQANISLRKNWSFFETNKFSKKINQYICFARLGYFFR